MDSLASESTLSPTSAPARDGRDLFFGATNLTVALATGIGVFAGLPLRWWVVDIPSVLVIGSLLTAAGGLLSGAPWGHRVARITGTVQLLVGLVLVTLLSSSVSYLWGTYGAVGRGGALVMGLIVLLVVPYFIVLPAAQLVWIGPSLRSSKGKRDGV